MAKYERKFKQSSEAKPEDIAPQPVYKSEEVVVPETLPEAPQEEIPIEEIKPEEQSEPSVIEEPSVILPLDLESQPQEISPQEESSIEEKINKAMEYESERMKEELTQSLYSDAAVNPFQESLPSEINLDGWNPLPIGDDVHSALLPPLNGTPVLITISPQVTGTVAFWKRTRAFANATKKWETAGIWCDFMTGTPINFKPQYWRHRHGV